MSEATRHFDQLFAGNNDPWAYRHSWYERRKRALTLAVLTRPRYASVFEPGCANGELSADLASRCDRLLCCDAAGAAVNLAKARLLGFPHARVEHSRLPEQWPAGPFDLIVLSELCYYLSTDDLHRLVDRALASLTDDGQLLACHWRPQTDDCLHTAQQVHDLLQQRLGMHLVVQHHESDFLLDLWSRDGTSVASHEGLR